MIFKEAYEYLKAGRAIRLPEWKGYWQMEAGNVFIHTASGCKLNMNGESDDMMYTLSFTTRDDWELVNRDDPKIVTQYFGFEEALRRVKMGKKISRIAWDFGDQFIIYQKGYPDGIPCNKQTADAWGLKEGDLFRCEPYLQIRLPHGSHQMWTPGIGDILATDWYEIHRDLFI